MQNKKFIVCLSCFLSSCTVGDDYKKVEFFTDEEMSKSLGVKNEKTEGKVFQISDFKDETLNYLIKDALVANPDMKIAILKLKQAREVLNIDTKNSLPMFDANAKYNFVNSSKNMESLIDNDYYQIGVDVSWEIDIFGGLRRKEEASRAQYRASIESLKNVNISLVSDVATNYINLRAAEQNLKNMRENILLQQDAYEIISEKFEVDLVDEMELAQSKYLLENMKMQVPQFEYYREMYSNALAVLLGKLPKSLDDVLQKEGENLVSKPFDYDLEKLYNLSVSVIRNRPDVKMMEEELIAQNALVGVAISNIYPKISLSGFFGFESLEFSDLIEKDSLGHSVIPQASLPLFHFFQLRDNIELQKLIKEEALVQYEKTILNAVMEVKNAMVALQNELERNKSAVLAYQNMSDVSYLMWKKYNMGLVEYSDVLNSEQNRLEAQTEMVNSNANIYKNIITFYKAIGGKYE